MPGRSPRSAGCSRVDRPTRPSCRRRARGRAGGGGDRHGDGHPGGPGRDGTARATADGRRDADLEFVYLRRDCERFAVRGIDRAVAHVPRPGIAAKVSRAEDAIMLKHNEHALELVDACLHGVLSDADAAIVKKHCEECPICRVAWDEAQKRFEALASLPAVETSSELIERTERRLEKAAARSPRSVPLRWFQRRSVYEKFGLVVATLAVMIGSLHLYYLNLSAAPYDLRVLGQDQLLSGAETSLRVTVFNQASRSLMAGVPVEIELARPATNESVQLASFRTDENGTGSPRFRLPDWQDGNCELRVAARIGRQVEKITHTVTLHRSWQLMVTTDKPVYQPGNPIRIRSLSLRRPDLKPVAGGDVTITVADPKGNIIFRRRDVTSRYGIASADCALADEILLGTYRIECRVGDTTSSTAV